MSDDKSSSSICDTDRRFHAGVKLQEVVLNPVAKHNATLRHLR